MREIYFVAQPGIWVNLPQNAKVKSWRVEEGKEIVVEFIIPDLFEGEIRGKIYWDKTEAFIEEMDIVGYYLYKSKHDWKWNHFEFEAVRENEANKIWNKILSGELLLEEMEYRKEAPEDEFPEFLDGYGPEVVADIANAIYQLFPGLLQQTG